MSMSDPQRPADRPGPRRANPVQPDRPAGASRTETPTTPPTEGPGAVDDRARQEKAAIDNVREGYGGG
jgi:hypothetical protein